jgi:hypothetical protein
VALEAEEFPFGDGNDDTRKIPTMNVKTHVQVVFALTVGLAVR